MQCPKSYGPSRGNTESEISYTYGYWVTGIHSKLSQVWNKEVNCVRYWECLAHSPLRLRSPLLTQFFQSGFYRPGHFSHPCDQGTFQLPNRGGVIYASYSTESSLKQLFCRFHLAFFHRISHVAPHTVILLVQIQWPQWPILRTATTYPSVRKSIQMLRVNPN